MMSITINPLHKCNGFMFGILEEQILSRDACRTFQTVILNHMTVFIRICCFPFTTKYNTCSGGTVVIRDSKRSLLARSHMYTTLRGQILLRVLH
jgi:hypothetical protein